MKTCRQVQQSLAVIVIASLLELTSCSHELDMKEKESTSEVQMVESSSESSRRKYQWLIYTLIGLLVVFVSMTIVSFVFIVLQKIKNRRKTTMKIRSSAATVHLAPNGLPTSDGMTLFSAFHTVDSNENTSSDSVSMAEVSTLSI